MFVSHLSRSGRFAALGLSMAVLGGLALYSAAAMRGGGNATLAQGEVAGERHGEGLSLTFGDEPALAEAFAGAQITQLRAFARDEEAGLWRRIPLQVDERAGLAGFVAFEDGLVDDDDELAWLWDDGGDPVSAGDVPPGLGEIVARAAIAAVDEQWSGETRWIHLFLAPEAPDDLEPTPLILWNAEERRISTAVYVLGFANSAPEEDGYFGINYLSLAGDLETDLVDRTKFRAVVETFGQRLSLTEENLNNVLRQFGSGDVNLDIEPVRVGHVRAVLSAAGGFAWPWRADLTIAAGAADAMPGAGPVQLPLSDLRISLDLSRRAVDAGALYLDANLDEPVAIDGVPDAVPNSPLPAWREIRVPTARAVLLGADDGAAVPSARAFYVDDEAGGPGDTGDGRSYGEHGVTADSLGDLFGAGFPGELVVVPADMDAEWTTAEALAAARAAAITLRVADVSGGLSEPTVEPGTTPTATATATVATGRALLPWAWR